MKHHSLKEAILNLWHKLKTWLQSLSFSFAQMLLPISVTAKGVLWTILFGLAKTCQYGGLTILGVEGYKRLKNKLKRKDKNSDD